MKHGFTRLLPVAGILIVMSGCAVMAPTGPSVVAMPSHGESLNAFQRDDYQCRSYASSTINPNAASQSATNNGVNSAAIGTLGGAAAGALLGAAAGNAGVGAAIGAGTGLLIGGANGANGAQATAGGLQAQYDAAYAQCMVSKGNTIQQPMAPVYQPSPVYYYAPPPAVYYGPPQPYWW